MSFEDWTDRMLNRYIGPMCCWVAVVALIAMAFMVVSVAVQLARGALR